MTSVSIPYDPPFRFDLALRYLQRSPDELIDLVARERHYRVIATAAGPSLIELSSEGTAIRATLLAGGAEPGDLEAATRRLYPAPSSGPYGEWDEPLATQLRASFGGLPVVQTLTPWEALVWAVIGQQINIAFAYRLKRAFVGDFGERVLHDDRRYFAFPAPERVAALDHERDLRPLQFSRQKSRYIIAAAQAVLDGTLDFEAIAALDDEAASAALQRQLGIGRWTAEYILLRGFGRFDVIPAGDAALKALVGQHLALGRSATELEVRELSERWKPWRGETAFMLWFAKQAGFFQE